MEKTQLQKSHATVPLNKPLIFITVLQYEKITQSFKDTVSQDYHH